MSFDVGDKVQVIKSCKLRKATVVEMGNCDGSPLAYIRFDDQGENDDDKTSYWPSDMILIKKGENQFKRNQEVSIIFLGQIVKATIIEPFLEGKDIWYRLKYGNNYHIKRAAEEIVA